MTEDCDGASDRFPVLSRSVIRVQQLARCRSEHAKAKPREFIPREVPIAAIGALRSDRYRH
jgi:hypothetical protein